MADDDHASWRRRCLEMAEATYGLAEVCDEPAMIRGYLDLAATWVRMAEQPRPPGRRGALRRDVSRPSQD